MGLFTYESVFLLWINVSLPTKNQCSICAFCLESIYDYLSFYLYNKAKYEYVKYTGV